MLSSDIVTKQYEVNKIFRLFNWGRHELVGAGNWCVACAGQKSETTKIIFSHILVLQIGN